MKANVGSGPPVPSGPLFPDVASYHHVLFTVGVDELRQLLSLVGFVISNAPWIPAGEWPTGRLDTAERYSRLVEAMRRSVPRLDPLGAESEMSVRLSRHRDIYVPSPERDGQVSLEQVEPDAELHVAGVGRSPHGKLQLNVLSQHAGGVLGLRLKYCKVATYASEGHACRHSTEGFPNFTLYREVEAWIIRNTKPCRFRTTGHDPQTATNTGARTPLRASVEGRRILHENWWLRSHGMELV